jgi:hypothetical protein
MADSTTMFKKCLRKRSALVAAWAGGAELTARSIGFGELPLIILDNKIEYYLAPSGNCGSGDIRVNRYGMRSDHFDLVAVDRRYSFSVFGDKACLPKPARSGRHCPSLAPETPYGKGRGPKSALPHWDWGT